MWVKSFFNSFESSSQTQELDQNKLAVAVCVILLEVAHSDDEFTSEEEIILKNLLKQKFNLSDEELDEVIEVSLDEREHAIDLWKFTHQIQKNFSHEMRLNLIENIWELIFSDDHMHSHEHALVNKLSNLLHIPHSELIQTKLKVLGK